MGGRGFVWRRRGLTGDWFPGSRKEAGLAYVVYLNELKRNGEEVEEVRKREMGSRYV